MIVTSAVISFVLALLLHEIGHWLAARLCSVPVTEIGLGWGPIVYTFKFLNVDYRIRMLPLGAYVKMDMVLLQQRPLLQQLFVLGAGIVVNIVLSLVFAGSIFGALNLGLAIGNILPFYQHDGWKSGIVVFRKLFGRPNAVVEWSFTLFGGLAGLALLAGAFLKFWS
jgi:membrane-associated protease RseP (regulator of RpoE activity)